MSRDTVVLLIVIAAVGTVLGGLILDAIRHSPGLVISWARRRIDIASIVRRIRQWLADNVAYVRNGFRLQAVLHYDEADRSAHGFICKRLPPVPTPDSQVLRMWELESRRFQSRKGFAWQAYATWVPRCPDNCRVLEINGWSSPELLLPGHTVWAVWFDNNNLVVYRNQSPIPGWSPIPSLPIKRRANSNTFIPPSRYSS